MLTRALKILLLLAFGLNCLVPAALPANVVADNLNTSVSTSYETLLGSLTQDHHHPENQTSKHHHTHSSVCAECQIEVSHTVSQPIVKEFSEHWILRRLLPSIHLDNLVRPPERLRF
jgi:hypothetical protein